MSKPKRVVIDGKQECIGCKQWLPLESFHRYKPSSTGRAWRCKECHKKTLLGGKTPSQRAREWALNNPERAKELARASMLRIIHNPKRLKARREKCNQWWKQNREKAMASHKQWRLNNTWAQVADSCRSLVRATLNGCLDGGPKFQTLVGCTGTQLRSRFEKLFQPGMTWLNFGRDGWTVGHIRSCAEWNHQLLTDKGQQECFHFSNLKPQWYHENCCQHSKQNLTKAQTELLKIQGG